MSCFQLTGLLLFIVCLLMKSCGKTQVEPGTDFPPDQETARIGGELCLMNLSQDAKNHTLKLGDGNAFIKTERIPAQVTQIHERTFYICPATHNPRLLLVGKIRVEVCREMEDYYNDELPPMMSNDMSQNPDSNPQ